MARTKAQLRLALFEALMDFRDRAGNSVEGLIDTLDAYVAGPTVDLPCTKRGCKNTTELPVSKYHHATAVSCFDHSEFIK